MLLLCPCSGLGYILGASAKVAAGDWHWALRVRASTALSHSARTHKQPLLLGPAVVPVMDLGSEGSVMAEALRHTHGAA